MELDTSLIRVPFESLRRTTRDRKYLVEAVDSLLQTVTSKNSKESPSLSLYDKKSLSEMLSEMRSQILSLKRKAQLISEAEADDIRRCRARLRHLQALGPPQKDGFIAWTQRGRLNRLLIDAMLRWGFHGSAEILTEVSPLLSRDTVDGHIFAEVRSALDALHHQHDCSIALQWCQKHHSRLTKMKSMLEFRLRCQEYIELIRGGQREEAVHYARKYLAPLARMGPDHLNDIRHMAGALLFSENTDCPRYRVLFEEKQWRDLGSFFLTEIQKLHGLTPLPELVIHLQAGLSALKTPASFEGMCSHEDPLHLADFQRLAEELPQAKHVHSKLVCALSGDLIEEDNIPMAFPNGYVYGSKALRAMADTHDGTVTCPMSGITCAYGDLKRVFTAA